jgi:hypothetical protein
VKLTREYERTLLQVLASELSVAHAYGCAPAVLDRECIGIHERFFPLYINKM